MAKFRKKVKGGTILFRRPNVAEKMIILGSIGISNQALVAMSTKKEEELADDPEMLVFMGKMLLKLQEYVVEVDVDFEGKKITDYIKLLDTEEYTDVLSEMAMSLLGDGAPPEKKQK